MTLEERIAYAKQEGHDFIAEKNCNYVYGKWEEIEHAQHCGWKVVGTVAELACEIK